MKYIVSLLIVAISSCSLAQTPSFVPRTNNTGSIGTSDKYWGTGYFNNVYYGGQTISSYVSSVKLTSFNALTGSVELVAGDGIKITTNGSQLRISFTDIPTAIGTNRVYFRYTGVTNFWTVPSPYSNIAIWAWGASGAGQSPPSAGSGGFSYGTFPVTNNQVISIVVGQGGSFTIQTNPFSQSSRAFPNGGRGYSYGTTGSAGGGGGGSSHVYFGTNLAMVAGGGGGTGGSIAAGSGGGVSGGNGGTGSGGGSGRGGTQTSGGSGGFPTSGSGGPAQSGSFLSGGDALAGTNTVSGWASSGGGGGGYYGGGGAFVNQNVFGGTASGGGGSGYINTDLGSGVTTRGFSTNTVGTEIPEYIAGTGNPVSSSSQNGLIVIGY